MSEQLLGAEEQEQLNTPLDDLVEQDVLLVFLGVDTSGSMGIHESTMAECLVDFKRAVKDSKEEHKILIARVDFSGDVTLGGFKRLEHFDTSYKDPTGLTALHQTIVEGAKIEEDYSAYLKTNGVLVKSVFAIFSDGEDTVGNISFQKAQKTINELNTKEVVTACIDFSAGAKIGKNLGFKNVIEAKDKTDSALRHLFGTFSKSVIRQSKSVVAQKDDFFNV